jgi:hypothetical protein
METHPDHFDSPLDDRVWMNPAAVELSIWIGDFGCFHHILSRALRSGIISLAVV